MNHAATTRRVLRRAGCALSAALLCALAVPLVAPAATAAAAPARDPVSVQVGSITPSTPLPSHTKRTLTITLELTNTTGRNLGRLDVAGVRGTPIETSAQLQRAIARPDEPDPSLSSPIDPDPQRAVTARLGPHASARVTLRTTTDIPQDAGICLCHSQAIYPLYFTVSSGDTVLGHTQSYLPAFDVRPRPVRVSWIWPLVDRPHRLESNQVFTDDELATSVSAGGRLDRMLQVVEDVGEDVPMTLVVDPALIDELAVMASGSYQVQQGISAPRDGRGTAAAQLWLARLRSVLDYPGTELYFTAPGDPDVQGLSAAGLTWQDSLGDTAMQRVREALGGHSAGTRLAWPADGTLRTTALDTLAAAGTRTVIVSDTSVAGRRARATSAPFGSLHTLSSASGGIDAVVTDRHVQRYVNSVLSTGGAGLRRLPQLVAEVAIAAVEAPRATNYVAVAAPRELNPDPAVAVRAIRDTATAFWAKPVTVGQAIATLHPAGHTRLVGKRAPQHLPSAVITAAKRVATTLPTLRTLFTSDGGAAAVLDPLPDAVQRLESISWRSDPVGAATRATELTTTVASMSDGVHLVTPSRGTYTLASSDSPLPVTVANDLDYAVRVVVRVSTVNGLAGLTATPKTEQVAPHSRVTVRVPTHVERTGRLQVVAELVTTDNVQLGSPVYLSVHSTALGTIGVIITIVAGVVLAVALLVRVGLRLRRHRVAPGTPDPDPVATATEAGP